MKRLFTFFSSLLLLLFNILNAQNIHYVKEGGTGNGSSWSDASGDLQAMINASSANDQVWVAKGTYKPIADVTGNVNPADARTKAFAMVSNVGIYGGFAGNETELTQRDWKNNPTILSGDFNGDDVISGSGRTLSITGNAENGYHVIFNNQNSLTNSALLDGFTITGGNASGGTFFIRRGGGVFNYLSSPAFANCNITGNAAILNGGGMHNFGSSVELTNCHFTKNTASSGGGIASESTTSKVNGLTMTNCSFIGNSATISNGGGMLSNSIGSSPANYTLTNVSFTGNHARSHGGGINSLSAAAASLTNCAFAGNTSDLEGGGMHNNNNSPVLTNCSFNGNTSRSGGGGIHNVSNAHPVLKNCILWGNSPEVVGDIPIISFSIVKGGFEGTGNLNIDPLFVDATNGNLRLQLCSPAIDAGTEIVDLPEEDLDGNARYAGLTVDMGAYEHQRHLPRITVEPLAEQSVCQNSPATVLTVSATGDDLTYQWYSKNSVEDLEGKLIANATEASYAPTTSTPGTQLYYVVVKNTCGKTITSALASVAITSPTRWYRDADGDGYGDPNIWKENCQQLHTFVANNDDCDDTRDEFNPETVWYHDADNDGYGESETDILRSCTQPDGYVRNAPCAFVEFDRQPLISQTVIKNTAAATLTVAATGEGLWYQWYRSATNSISDAVTIPLANNSTYTPPTNVTGTFYYFVTVSNVCGRQKTSEVATVVVNEPVCTTPMITSVASPLAPVPLGTAVNVSANFAATNIESAIINWGDGSGDKFITNPSASQSYTYPRPGVYTVSVRITNDCGEISAAAFPMQYVVVYDPTAGFVTGGGWINSPVVPSLSMMQVPGKAHFGFESKYQKGKTVPSGNTEFKFVAGGLEFRSASYEWLVLSGSKAQFKGVGSVNGNIGYGFLLTATDGDLNKTKGPDMFRVKIWQVSNYQVVYDNQAGAADDADPTTQIGGGSVVIHVPAGKASVSLGRVGAIEETSAESSGLSFNAFPNPTTNHFNLAWRSNHTESISIRITDALGRLVEDKIALPANGSLNFGKHFRPGVYLVQMLQGKKQTTLRLMKQ